MHPVDRLPDYVLGWLDAPEQREIEAHLAGCGRCQGEVRALREGLLHLSDTLTEQVPARRVWDGIQTRLRADTAVLSGATPPPQADPWTSQTPPVQGRAPAPRSRQLPWLPLGLAASLVLLAASLGWGGNLVRERRALATSQATVSAWLTDPSVRLGQLREAGQPVLGSALLRGDGLALILLAAAPPSGQSFQVWGISENTQQQRTITSLGLTDGRAVKVRWQGYRALWLSLEPSGGSVQPSRPLGRLRLTASAQQNMVPGVPLSATDRTFLPVAVMNNQFEIEASKLAQSLGQDRQVRTYAQNMIGVHTGRLATLRATARSVDPAIRLPPGVSREQQQMLDALKTAGPRFDTLYKRDMETIHAQTYALFEGYAGSGTANEGLKQLVQAALSTVKMHWDTAKQLPGGAK